MLPLSSSRYGRVSQELNSIAIRLIFRGNKRCSVAFVSMKGHPSLIEKFVSRLVVDNVSTLQSFFICIILWPYASLQYREREHMLTWIEVLHRRNLSRAKKLKKCKPYILLILYYHIISNIWVHSYLSALHNCKCNLISFFIVFFFFYFFEKQAKMWYFINVIGATITSNARLRTRSALSRRNDISELSANYLLILFQKAK
jgi:hypothetical protein